ncbi:MAG TPA: class I SAM-dependent methyltransferase [Verrucomicrobiae bacterium]|nr:class I SAM-dependent methyltransferase [Verrucomicrobiae bacterium]
MPASILEPYLKKLDACPLCGGRERKHLYELEHTQVYKCACGLSYLDPCLDPAGMAAAYESSETLKALNEFHDGYYEYGSLDTETKTLQEFNASLGLLEKHGGGCARRLFEVGFGNGLFLALAKKRGWQVDGIDTSRTNAELAREKFGLHLKTGFFEALDASGEKPQAAAILDVIEHVPDPHKMIRKAHELLAPGGLLLIATPNEASFLRLLSDLVYRLSGGKIKTGIKKIYFLEHVTYFDRASLTRLLEQNGFQPVEHFYSSTDLAKYRLNPLERLAGEIIILLQKIFRRQNRLLMVARKK